MKKHVIILTMLLVILTFNQCFSQTYGDCGTNSNMGYSSDPARGVNCSNSGTAWMTKYRTPQYWIPNNSTPIKTILVNIIACRDDSGNNGWQDSPQFRADLTQLYVLINNRYSNVHIKGYTSTCEPAINYIIDTRIRFEVNEIIFLDKSIYNQLCSTDAVDTYVRANYPSSRKAMNHIFTSPPYYCGYMGYYSTNNGNGYVHTSGMWAHAYMNHPDYVNHFCHEYGHAIGLGHTYNSEVTQISNFDFLDDVFGTCTEPSMSDPANLCFANCGAPGAPCAYNPSAGNVAYLQGCFFSGISGAPLMCGGPDATYISPKSAGRMHRALSLFKNTFGLDNRPMHQYVKERYSYSIPLEITSNETWDFAMQMYQDIVVKTGNTLTIACEVRMPINGKITVESGAQLIINGGVITSAWDAMWSGIILNPGSSLLVDNSATIENAKLAVDSKGGAQFTIQNSNLKNNFRNILMEAYSGIHPGSISNTVISCVNSSNMPANSLILPYAGQRTYSGIEINNVTQANIGVAASGQSNSFNNMDLGIYSTSSGITVYNNNFTNITYPGGGTAVKGRCVFSRNLLSTELPVKVGGSASFQANSFTNSYIGVLVHTNQDAIIQNNNFSNLVHSGIYTYYCSGAGNDVTISNNTLNDCGTCIYSYGNGGSHMLNISYNNIDPASPGSGAQPSGYGIYISNPVSASIGCNPALPSSCGLSILFNNVYRLATGISVTNIMAPDIENNNVYTLSDLGSGVNSTGIYITACPSMNIRNNLVQGNGAASWWMTGIRIESSPSSVVLYNSVENIGRGLFFGGNNNPIETAKNHMKNNYDGFMLNYGVIGYPNPCKASENTFEGDFSLGHHFFSYYSDGSQSQQFVTGSQCNTLLGPCMYPNNLNSGVYPTSGYPNLAITTSYCSTLSGRSADHNKRVQWHKIAKGEGNYAIYDASQKWWGKYHLYNILKSDTTLQDGDSDLQAFADSASASNLGKLFEINKSINSNSSIAQAVVNNNAINVNNSIEQNLKDVNAITISSLSGAGLSSNDITKLKTIAALCPYESGPAVYNARAILSTIDKTVYNNTCEIVPKIRNRAFETISSESEKTNIDVYPNPANDKLNIGMLFEDGQTANIQIYDLTGKLVLEHVLDNAAEVNTISIVALKPGLYMFKINSNNHLIDAGKLSIIR